MRTTAKNPAMYRTIIPLIFVTQRAPYARPQGTKSNEALSLPTLLARVKLCYGLFF